MRFPLFSTIPSPNSAKGRRPCLSFFGGIGDARHLLRTLIGISEFEKPSKVRKRYHFTIVDINKCAIVRDLIVFMLLDKLSDLDMSSDEALTLRNTIFFSYMSTMMPHFAFNRLHKTIDQALTCLKSGKQPLKWVYLHTSDIPLYIEVLTNWRGKGLNLFTPSKAISIVTTQLKNGEIAGFAPELLPGCKKDNILYFGTAMLRPSEKILELYDPGMLELLQDYSNKPKQHMAKFRKYLRDNWSFNTTLLDIDWYDALTDKNEYDIGFDPFQSLGAFQDENLRTKLDKPSRLFHYFSPFFLDAANSIKQLRERLTVEATLGDLVDTAERIRFGLYDDPDVVKENCKAADHVRPKTFPVLYDRIHLRNVP
jgi:hypothetical protein